MCLRRVCRKPNRNDVEETNLRNTRRQTRTLATFTIQPHASNQLRAGMYVHAYSHIVLICLRLPNNLNIVHSNSKFLSFFSFLKLPSAPSHITAPISQPLSAPMRFHLFSDARCLQFLNISLFHQYQCKTLYDFLHCHHRHPPSNRTCHRS